MSKKIGLNNIIYITGQPREWVIKNIYKFGFVSRKGKYYANAKALEKFLIYSNELDLKENTLYKLYKKK